MSNERVPTQLLSRAYLQVYDRYPIGASAIATLPLPTAIAPDGRFSIDAPPGEYWVGARLGNFSALRGPVVVTTAGGPQDLVLRPDFINIDVVTRHTPEGAEMVSATVVAVDPVTRRFLNRAAVTVVNGANRWHLPLVRVPGGAVYQLGGLIGRTPVDGDEFTVIVSHGEDHTTTHTRVLHLATLDSGTRLLEADSRPNPELAPEVHGTVGYEVRWHTPPGTSFSIVCLLADSGTFLLSGCDQAVTSPHRLDISGLTEGQPYELQITVGRAVAEDGGSVFNLDSITSPLVIGDGAEAAPAE